MPRVLVGDFGEGHVEGSGKVGTGTIEVLSWRGRGYWASADF